MPENYFDQYDGYDSVPSPAPASGENHFDKYDQAEGVKESSWQQKLSSIARPFLEGGGAMVGGIVGAPAGPLGMVAGGTLGYGIGKQGSDRLDEALGVREPKQGMDIAKEAVSDLATGATYELGGAAVGAALVPVFRAGKWTFNKVKDMADFTPRGFTNKASDIMKANTSYGEIYAKNADEAAALERDIPGLRFSRAQATGDPQMIKLQRAHERTTSSAGSEEANAASRTIEQRARNNEALRNYYERAFPQGAGIDDVTGTLESKRAGLQENVQTAEQMAQGEAQRVGPRLGPQEGGKVVRESLQGAQKAARGQASDLYGKVPEMDVDIQPLVQNMEDISKPMTRFEDVESNVPPLFERIAELSKKAPTKPEGAQISMLSESVDRVKPEVGGKIIQTEKAVSTEKLPEIKFGQGNEKEFAANALRELKRKQIEQTVKESKIPDVPFGKYVKLTDLQGMRAEIGEEIRTAKAATNPNNRLISRLEKFRSAIDENIQGLESGSEELATANKFYREKVVPFRQGTTGDVLSKAPTGEFRIPESEVIPKFFSKGKGGLDAADEFIKTVGGNKQAKSAVRDYAAYDLLQNVMDNEGKISGRKLNVWLYKNKETLRKFNLQGEFEGVVKAQKAVDMAQGAADSFEKGVAGKLLGADPERAIAASLTGNDLGKKANELVKMVKDNPQAKKGLQKAFADHMLGMIQTTAKDIQGGQMISPAQFSRVMKKYSPAMEVIYRGEPEKIKTLQNMKRAYEIAARTSTSPLGGGSDTAENIMTAMSKMNVLSRTASVIKAVGKAFSKYKKDQVDEILTRALFEPETAGKLQKIASAKTIKEVQDSAAEVIRLDDVRRMRKTQFGVGAALTMEDED